MRAVHGLLLGVSRIGVWLLGAGYLVIALATTLDIALRNLAGASVPGVYELSGYVFAVATTWGFAFVLLERGHVRIDVGYRRMPPRVRAWFDISALLAMGLFVAMLTWRAWGTLEDTLLFDARARTTLQTPLWIPQSLWLAGLAYFLLTNAFLLVWAVALAMGGRHEEIARIAGIPHAVAPAIRRQDTP